MAERVLERIRADGPLSALDFERERGPTTDWFGMPTNAVRAVLEAYRRHRACSGSRDVTATAATTTSSNGCCRPTLLARTSR